MNRIEFLKRLGLGAVAAVAAPALIKSNPEIVETDQLAFWRQSDGGDISSEPTFISAEQDFSPQFAFDWSFHKSYP